MTMRKLAPTLTTALAATGLIAAAALAHHGWNWAEDEQTELQGTIQAIYIGPPHPELQVEATDGQMWTVELGNPRQTEASGFVEGVSAPGDPIVVRGHRSLDPDDIRIKAVRITIEDAQYDLYPNLIQHDH
jgi:hypothetical protein